MLQILERSYNFSQFLAHGNILMGNGLAMLYACLDVLRENLLQCASRWAFNG